MAIHKATLAKQVDGVVEYIYPKTAADIVQYDDNNSVYDILSSILENGVSGGTTDEATYATTAGSADTLITARNIDGVAFDGSSDIMHYGVCSTASATKEKVVNIDGFLLLMEQKYV